MKKSKLTIAVLSACMLAATGGISLGAAALANAPEAVSEASGGGLASKVISNGIDVIKREVSRSGDSITFTYSVSPANSNATVTADLSWNGQTNDSIKDYLEIVSHTASTKTIVVRKKAMFGTQAKLVLAAGRVGNASATVLIDCIGFVTPIATDFDAPVTVHTESEYLVDEYTNLAAADFSDAVGKAFSVTWGSRNDGVRIDYANVRSERMYFDNSPTSNSAYFANAHTPSDSSYTTWLDQNAVVGNNPGSDGIWGSIGLKQADIYSSAKQFCYDDGGVYGHFQAVLEFKLHWDYPNAQGTGISPDGGEMVYAAYVWDLDFTAYAGPASITAEAGHIYF